MADPRADRTRAALRAAALDLASKAPIGNIAVSALTEAAQVNRATFYSHYRAVSEVVIEALTADLDALREEEQRMRHDGELDSAAIIEWSIDGVLEHLHRYESLYRNALDAASGSAVWASMREHFATSIEQIMARQPEPIPHIHPKLAAAYGAAALTGVLEAWLRDDDATLAELRTTINRSLPEWWRNWQ